MIVAPVTKDMDSSHAICVEVETDNQQTDLGLVCYGVNLPQHGSHYYEYWVINCKNNVLSVFIGLCRIIVTMLKDNVCMFELCCFQICELIKNYLIHRHLPHVPLLH